MGTPPDRLEVTAILDPKPSYSGTSHDDATARAMGFRAALIPGAFVYGHVTRMAVQGWGIDWLARGRANVRFRRPVHHGDPLLITRGPLQRDGDGLSAEVTIVHTGSGETVLAGTIGLADAAPQPPAELPVLPVRDPPLEVVPGGLAAGLRLGSGETLLDGELVGESLDDFHETEPLYRERRLIHSGCLVRRTMGDVMANLVLPMPLIFAAVEVQNLAPAPVGGRYRTSAAVTRVWEDRGRHYFDSEEWLIADGRLVVARHLRRNLYAMSG